MTAKEVLWF